MRRMALSIAVLAAAFGAAPAEATPGAGAVVGMVDYSSGPPPLGNPCTGVAFDIEATSLTASVGRYSATGSGSGFCESTELGGGIVSLSVDFEAVDGTVYDCPTTVGTYTRTAYQFDVLASAACTVNGSGTARLVVTMRATLMPDTPYGWFAGTFAVLL